MTTEEIDSAVEFMSHAVFNPTDPEMETSVRERVPEELLSPSSRIILNDEINKVVGATDEDARFVLKKINARKAIPDMYGGPHQVATEGVDGLFLVAKRGELGLSRG